MILLIRCKHNIDSIQHFSFILNIVFKPLYQLILLACIQDALLCPKLAWDAPQTSLSSPCPHGIKGCSLHVPLPLILMHQNSKMSFSFNSSQQCKKLILVSFTGRTSTSTILAKRLETTLLHVQTFCEEQKLLHKKDLKTVCSPPIN